MRVSLKQTVLLTTALIALNLPTIAMEKVTLAEEGVADTKKLTAAKLHEEETVALTGPHFEKAKKYSQNFFASEIEASYPVFFKISELINEEEKRTEAPSVEVSNTSQTKAKGRRASVAKEVISAPLPEVTIGLTESNVEQPAELVLLKENLRSFTLGQFALTAQHLNRPHPDFNAIYTTLADSFLETTVQRSTDETVPGITETLERLSKIHAHFKQLIETRTQKIDELRRSIPEAEAKSNTASTQSAAETLIDQYNLENKELKERFKNLLQHFSHTRSFIMQASETIATKEGIIKASSSTKDLTFKNTAALTSTTNDQLSRDILFLKRLKLDAETLLHTLYDFDRTDLELSNAPTLISKGLVLATSAISAATGKITNVFKESRTLRYEQTGFSLLPMSITISAAFNPDQYGGTIDEDLHTRYIAYVQKMLKITPALLDASNEHRILFTPIVPTTTISIAAEAKSSVVDEKDEKKGDEV